MSEIKYIDMDVHKEGISIKTLSTAVFTLLLASLQPLVAQVQGQWVSTGTMQSVRALHAQVRLATGGKVLSIGGVDSLYYPTTGNIFASTEVYNPGPGTWTLAASMAEAREEFPAVVLASGKVLVSGGQGEGGSVLADAELYDPTTGLWSSAGSLSVARFYHTATLLTSGKVLVTGGCMSSTCNLYTAVSELYDPGSNSWSPTGSLNTARYNHTALRLKTGKVLVIGGSSNLNRSCELYDPRKGTWSNAASTNDGRYLNTATLLGDGKVLVTGGSNGGLPPRTSAELYDPTANTWTQTGIMTKARSRHTATLLTDGTVLLAGGVGRSTATPIPDTEIYNEATGRFSAAAILPRAVAYHSMTLLATGRVLVNGGYGYTSPTTCCAVVNDAEVFTPQTMTLSPPSLNFGLQQIGLPSSPQTVTVTNVSSHSATITSVGSSGNYFQSHTCPITPNTLNPNESCTITVTFTPTAAGTRTGAVTLHDNDPGSPTQTIAATGTGEALALGLTPGSLNLGSVSVGSSATQSATLTNDGVAPVSITGVSISPPGGTFTQTNNCPGTLDVQQTCAFQIVFTPPDVSNYKATLSVSNNAGGPATLPLSGAGLDGP